MPRRRSARRVQCRHFSWLLRRRGRMWVADGRGNTVPVGRHSLATDDYQTALKMVEKLDATLAVKHGLAPASSIAEPIENPLALEDGKDQYLKFAGRPRVAGGVRASSLKRYRTALDKFCDFAKKSGLTTWNEVSSRTLKSYAGYLEREQYAYRSQYTELTTLKQATSGFGRKSSCRKPSGSNCGCGSRREPRPGAGPRRRSAPCSITAVRIRS